MTTTPQAASREAFTQWADSMAWNTKMGWRQGLTYFGDRYAENMTEAAWLSWQAATSQQQGEIEALRKQVRILRAACEGVLPNGGMHYGHVRQALQLADAVKGGEDVNS